MEKQIPPHSTDEKIEVWGLGDFPKITPVCGRVEKRSQLLGSHITTGVSVLSKQFSLRYGQMNF